MRKKHFIWIAAAILAFLAWRHFENNSGAQTYLVVKASLRPDPNRGRSPARSNADTNFPVLFEMLNHYKLTSIEVTEVVSNAAPGAAHILWRLVSTNISGSDPVKLFYYGRNPKGMAPYLKGINAEPLLPNVPYQLDIEAGAMKGSTIFQTVPLPD